VEEELGEQVVVHLHQNKEYQEHHQFFQQLQQQVEVELVVIHHLYL
jgi:hypothetical protein